MYLRTVRAKGADGVELEYVRLVEAYWEKGQSKQRVVANLGRKDLLAPHLESLIKLLGGEKTNQVGSSCSEEASYRREGHLAIDSFKCQGGCHDQLWHFTAGSCDASVSLH